MREGLIAIAIITLFLTEGCFYVIGIRAQEVRHSPDIGLRLREGALAVTALLEWLNASGMGNLSNNLLHALISGNTSELKQDLNKVELLIESTPALYAVSSEVLVGLKAAEGVNASLTPNDLASLLLVAYKQALRNNHLKIAEAILDVLNAQKLSTEELKSVLTEIEAWSNSGSFGSAITSAINEVLKALHNGTLLDPDERTEFAAKIAVKNSLLISALLQSYEPQKPLSSTPPNIREGVKGPKESRITPEDMIKAMYLLEKFGPKTFFVLKHLPTYRVLIEIIQPNTSALSILKSIPYGALVSVEGIEGNHSVNELKEIIHSGINSIKAGMSETKNTLKIPPKLLSELTYLTNEIKKITNTTYLNGGGIAEKLQKTFLNSSVVAGPANVYVLVFSKEIYLILAITSLITVAIVWLSLYQTTPYQLPHAKVSKRPLRRIHPFWIIISKYAEEAGITLKPSLTHREAFDLLISSAKRVVSNSIAGLLKDLMMVYEFVTYRGDNEALYTNKVNEILRRLNHSD